MTITDQDLEHTATVNKGIVMQSTHSAEFVAEVCRELLDARRKFRLIANVAEATPGFWARLDAWLRGDQ